MKMSMAGRGIGVSTAEGAYSEGSFSRTRHRPTVQQHFLNDNLARIFHSEGNHGQAVTDKDHLHARCVGDVGTGEVMGSHHCDRLTPPVQGAECTDGDLLSGVGRRSAHRRV